MNPAPSWQRRPGADNWQAENGKACDDAFALRLQAATQDLRDAREAATQPARETTTHE